MRPLPASDVRNTVRHGDCIRLMSRMEAASVDFILTDPPYLVRYRDRSGRSIRNDTNGNWLRPAFSEMFRLLKADAFCMSFYGWNEADQFITAWRQAGFRIVGHLVFHKSYASSSRFLAHQHEQAYLLTKGSPLQPESPLSDVRSWTYTGNRLHPTQKPVDELRPLIRQFCPKGGLVLDPFCGSGSTLAAAVQDGRDFLGIELDYRYWRISTRRLTSS